VPAPRKSANRTTFSSRISVWEVHPPRNHQSSQFQAAAASAPSSSVGAWLVMARLTSTASQPAGNGSSTTR